MNGRTKLSKRWFASLFAIGCQALFQIASIALLARILGPTQYSSVVAASAVSAIAAEIVALGSGNILIQEVSRRPELYPGVFWQALRTAIVLFTPTTLFAGIIAWFIFQGTSAIWVIILLTASDVLHFRSLGLAEQIAIAHHRTFTANILRITTSGSRFLVVGAAVLSGVDDVSTWSIFYGVSALLTSAVSLTAVTVKFGKPRRDHGTSFSSGAYFTVANLIAATQLSIDKLVLGAAASPAIVGAYGIASRIAQFGVLPASALTRIIYPVFFEKGSEGVSKAARYGRHIAPAIIGLAILGCVGVAGASLLIPFLLGPEFGATISFLFVLALLPLAVAAQNLAGDVLSGSDMQRKRATAAGAGLVLTAASTIAGAHFGGAIGTAAGYVIGQYLHALLIAGILLIALRSGAASQRDSTQAEG